MTHLNLTSKEILQKQRDIVAPFCFSVVINGSSKKLRIDQVLRVLPGKRLVALVSLEGESFFLKIFLGLKSYRNFCKDLEGILAIQRHDIKTPDIVAHGQSEDGESRFILFQYLNEAQDLEKILACKDKLFYDLSIKKSLALIFKGYEKGLIQKDIHLGNFLLYKNDIYWIDGAEVVSVKKTELSTIRILSNLALFFAQFPLENDRYINYAMSLMGVVYIHKKIGLSHRTSSEHFKDMVNENRRIILLKYRKKLGRESTLFVCKKNWGQYLIYTRTEHSKFNNLSTEILDKLISDGEIIKAGNSATVAKIIIDGKQYVIKRYNIKNILHGFKRLFKPSRAWKSWCSAHCLLVLGILTPVPLLMLEKRYGPFRNKAYLITEFVDLEDLTSGIKNHKYQSQVLNNLQNKVGKLLMDFKSQMISHGDMKGTNILLNDESTYIIDLDSMEFHQNKRDFLSAEKKDKLRMSQNWPNN